MPVVSVIVPVYNAERFIAETIATVQQQTLTDWELLLIDDGSTDQTPNVIRPFLADSRIRYIRKENAGVSEARNTGIEIAAGEYYAFLDADDLWDPQNLEKKVAAIREQGTDFSFSDLEEIDEHSQTIGHDHRNGAEILANLLEWKTVLGPPANLVIRNIVFTEGKLTFDRQFSTAADQDFAFRLAAQYNGTHLPEPLLRYRVLANSMSRNIAVMEKDHIGVYRKAAANGLFNSASQRRKAFANLYLILAGSWWKQGNNKLRGCGFILRALFSWPPVIVQLFSKKL